MSSLAPIGSQAGPLEGLAPSQDPGVVRVMLVDDSAVIRRVVSRVLEGETGIEVVGIATNGQEALDRIERFRPDVIILDVEMPVLDGVATLKQLRPKWPALPVIMFSTLTSKAASATLDALAAGANDYSTKPGSIGGSLDATMDTVRSELVPLIRAWGEVSKRRLIGRSGLRTVLAPNRPTTPVRPAGPAVAPRTENTPAARRVAPPVTTAPPVKAVARITGQGHQRIDAVVIGSSAGGPNALAELIPQFPADLPVPMLLTQHMPETFTQLLASRLDSKSRLTVLEAEAGTELQAGHLYVAKGGHHLVVARRGGRLVLDFDEGPPENYCRPAVDVMFRSAVDIWGAHLLAVVLTGMGRDGVEGARTIVQKGGTVLTQDEDTCLVWGMPGAVVEAGLSHETLPLDRIFPAVMQRLKAVRTR